MFLDTQVFVQQNFQYNRGPLEAFRQHVNARRLQHVTTDLAVNEVKAKLAEAVDAAENALKKFQSHARVFRNLSTPSIAQIFKARSRSKILHELVSQFDTFLDQLHTTVLSTDAVKPSLVFKRYFSKEPPFGDPRKQSEFRDAFNMEALLHYMADNGRDITAIAHHFRTVAGTG